MKSAKIWLGPKRPTWSSEHGPADRNKSSHRSYRLIPVCFTPASFAISTEVCRCGVPVHNDFCKGLATGWDIVLQGLPAAIMFHLVVLVVRHFNIK